MKVGSTTYSAGNVFVKSRFFTLPPELLVIVIVIKPRLPIGLLVSSPVNARVTCKPALFTKELKFAIEVPALTLADVCEMPPAVPSTPQPHCTSLTVFVELASQEFNIFPTRKISVLPPAVISISYPSNDNPISPNGSITT